MHLPHAECHLAVEKVLEPTPKGCKERRLAECVLGELSLYFVTSF